MILDEIVEAGERTVAIVRDRSVEELRSDLNAGDALAGRDQSQQHPFGPLVGERLHTWMVEHGADSPG